MCGLAGIMARVPRAELGPLARELSNRLRHRGPDDDGFWSLREDQAGPVAESQLDEPVSAVLGHRRLSIVDLVGGQQPMSNEDGAVWVTLTFLCKASALVFVPVCLALVEVERLGRAGWRPTAWQPALASLPPPTGFGRQPWPGWPVHRRRRRRAGNCGAVGWA